MRDEWWIGLESDEGIRFGAGEADGDGSERLVPYLAEGKEEGGHEMAEEIGCPS